MRGCNSPGLNTPHMFRALSQSTPSVRSVASIYRARVASLCTKATEEAEGARCEMNPVGHPRKEGVVLNPGESVAVCRCWQSAKFPLCDGTFIAPDVIKRELFLSFYFSLSPNDVPSALGRLPCQGQ